MGRICPHDFFHEHFQPKGGIWETRSKDQNEEHSTRNVREMFPKRSKKHVPFQQSKHVPLEWNPWEFKHLILATWPRIWLLKSRHQTAGRSTGDVGVGSCLVMVGGLHFPSSVTQRSRVAVLSQNGYGGWEILKKEHILRILEWSQVTPKGGFFKNGKGVQWMENPFLVGVPSCRCFFFMTHCLHVLKTGPGKWFFTTFARLEAGLGRGGWTSEGLFGGAAVGDFQDIPI